MLQNHKSLERKRKSFRTVCFRGSELRNIKPNFPVQPQRYLQVWSSSDEDHAFVMHLLRAAAVLWFASWSSPGAHKWAGHHSFQPMGSLQWTEMLLATGDHSRERPERHQAGSVGAVPSLTQSGGLRDKPGKGGEHRESEGKPYLTLVFGTLPGCYHGCFPALFPTGVHLQSEGSYTARVTKAMCPFCVSLKDGMLQLMHNLLNLL